MLALAVALVAVLLLGQWWYAQQQIADVREDVAQRLRGGEVVATENRVMLKSMQENLQTLQAKVNVIENRQGETQSQQLALEQMYQELARSRDDWTLAEIEQVLSTANQQLQLAGNVQGAIIALQNAETRIAQSDTPQFLRLRRAIGEDLERLKALPSVDLSTIALRLDSAINQIDKMPLLVGERPAEGAAEPKIERRSAPPVDSGEKADWLARIENLWQSWSSEFWHDIRQVIRVRNVQEPDALLLSPSEAYFVRENLKLRLLNARLALLTRNEAALSSDLASAQDIIAQYFDARARETQTVQALLRQVQQSPLSIELPSLSASLNAVRGGKPASNVP